MGLIESCSKICSKNEGPQTFPNAKQTNLSPPENFIEVDSNEQSQNASISEIIPSRESKILIMKHEKKMNKITLRKLKSNLNKIKIYLQQVLQRQHKSQKNNKSLCFHSIL